MEQKANLDVHYNELLNNLSSTCNIQEEIQKLTEKNDYRDRDAWLKGLALCDLALKNNSLTKEVEKLYLQLYRKNWNLYYSSPLNETEYNYWFQLCEEINDRFIQAGFYRAYVERDYMLETARRPHRNREKEKECLQKGMEHGDSACMAVHGYNLFFGMRGEQENKEEGMKLMQKAKELGYDQAGSYLLSATYYTETDNAKVLSAIETYMQSKESESEKSYHLLAEYYLYKEENTEKALDALNKGIAGNNPYCKYVLGINILNGKFEDQGKTKGIELLEEAYEYGVIYAANWLGRYYYYTQDEFKSLEKSIEWHEKAKLYYFEDSLVELALTYLYEEQVKDQEKGMIYLDWAIQEGSARAMSEKAHFLLNQKNPNLEEAAELLNKATELGDSYAPYRLGLMYERGNIGEPDYYKAFELYQLSAERGHIYGVELTGHYYRVGVTKNEEADPEKAVEFLNRAIERGSDYAKVELALCYETGFGVEKDFQKSYDLYKSAADNNYAYAYNKVGYYEEDGLVGEKNYDKAFEYFQKSAGAGYAEGIYNVGRAYRYALGVPENPELALENYQKAAEYEYGDAYIELALAYENEYGGLEFDAEKAMDYMTKAAEQGYSYAQYKVGYYYYYGLVEKNFEKALEWLHKSYERGYPYAAILLGDYYLYNDEGLQEPEYDKSFEYYKMAEEKGVVSEGLGVCYEYGIGTEENTFEAFKYYTAGAEAGYTAAKYRLGTAYKYGIGTDENQGEAYCWLSEAAHDGNFQAKYLTARMLLEGEGTTQDIEQGVAKLKEIAEENHADAQFELGNCYLTGKGVPEDEVQAMVWYQKAAENGHEQALKITGKRERRRR